MSLRLTWVAVRPRADPYRKGVTFRCYDRSVAMSDGLDTG
jgi:hypothetical protein